MKLSSFFSFAAFALASAGLAQAVRSNTTQQVFEDMTKFIGQEVTKLNKGFNAYVGGSIGEAAGAYEASQALGKLLLDATALINTGKLNPDDKDGEQILRAYKKIEERIGRVTEALAENKQRLIDDKLTFFTDSILPLLETYLDCFGSTLPKLKFSKDTRRGILTSWRNTDDLMEGIMNTFKVADQTKDPNHKAKDASKADIKTYEKNYGKILPCPIPIKKPAEVSALIA